MKRKILVVYYWMSKHGNGFGNVDFTTNWGTPYIESIRDIERQLREMYGFDGVVVLNIIDLGVEEECESEDAE